MKIKLTKHDYIKMQKDSQEKLVELLGTGTYSVKSLEEMLENIKNTNKIAIQGCKTNITTTTRTCGGSIYKVEIPSSTQSKMFKDNTQLITMLTNAINIAKANNVNDIKDFGFNDKQIEIYATKENII